MVKRPHFKPHRNAAEKIYSKEIADKVRAKRLQMFPEGNPIQTCCRKPSDGSWPEKNKRSTPP